ncbi:MAG: hypothetical protein JNJ58_11275 [Chitinophagaceae bacterium]|nr:hypothetical protein [Chitinophagaceae bacterium]
MKNLLWIGVSLLCFSACNRTTTCIEPQTVVMRGGFYHSDTAGKPVDTLLQNANVVFGGDTLFFVNIKKSHTFSLTLSPLQDSVRLFFQSDSSDLSPELIDTIFLKYTRELSFISTACGFKTFYNLNAINSTTHIIDSIWIAQANVNSTLSTEHVKIRIRN